MQIHTQVVLIHRSSLSSDLTSLMSVYQIEAPLNVFMVSG
jgi:hypothetical protein